MHSASRREISWSEYGEMVKGLALKAAGRKPDVVVGIARGGDIVGCSVSFLLGVEYYPMRLQKVGVATRVVVAPSPELAGRQVLLVDDFSASGDTFRIARHELSHVGVGNIITCALVRRVPGYSPDLWAFDVGDKVRFPWAAEQIIDGEMRRRDEPRDV